MRDICLLPCISLILLLALLAPASGHETCPPPRTLKKCGKLGERFYAVGQYNLALQAFQQAYLIKPFPIFLFNMAQSHRQAGRKAEALDLYERYLREDPRTDRRAEVDGYTAELRAKMEAERKEDELRRQQLLAVQMKMTQPDSPPSQPIYKRWWFWTAVGVVAAGAVAGAVAGTYHPAPSDPPGLPIYNIH